MQGELIKAERDGNACKITALIYDAPAVLDRVAGLAGKEVSIQIALPKEKRSLDSNDYFWALVRGLAKAIHGNATEKTMNSVYLHLLKLYGQCVVITISSKIDISTLGWKYYEKLKDGIISGKSFTAYKLFIGSSQYTQEQMSKLIKGTKEECKEYGVKTELDDFSDFLI